MMHACGTSSQAIRLASLLLDGGLLLLAGLDLALLRSLALLGRALALVVVLSSVLDSSLLAALLRSSLGLGRSGRGV